MKIDNRKQLRSIPRKMKLKYNYLLDCSAQFNEYEFRGNVNVESLPHCWKEKGKNYGESKLLQIIDRKKITHFGISRNKLIKIFQIIFERNLRLQANISVRNLIIYIMSYLSNAAAILFHFYFFVDLAKIIHNH